ncbi:uncharacterized protein LOC116029669 [Ipomoea triloba]|uniref:uncharacterized protein LOC116029669 n=1 Tax=Ipomoea triloba TaxID=35885 RepID=UPI00125E7609|nr:uncharacterized protein LOC116029669 [Ipomoea triloba]
MDKSWMNASRISQEYDNGVKNFINFAKNNLPGSNERLLCPYKKCCNQKRLCVKDVYDDLICHVINPSYTKWIWHGESNVATTSNMYVDNEENEDDESEDQLDEMFRDVGEEFIDRSSNLDELLKDSKLPLWPGCSKYTRLSTVLKLFNLKAGNGWSDKSFTALLEILKEMLPDDNELPKSTYDAKKILCPMGMGYKKIHVCPNDCILFRNDYKDLHACPVCGASRFKTRENVTGKVSLKSPPAKVMWYLPILSRFKRMFANPSDAKNLTRHADQKISDGKLRHPADSRQWTTFDNAFPEFGHEPRNLRLGLCTDGNDIDVFLAPLIEDLKSLWDEGVLVFDAYRKESFKLHAVLFCTINDFPACGNLSGYSVKGHKVCPICEDNTCYHQLVHDRKTVYMGHRRFLDKSHPYRRLKKAFNGVQDYTDAPQPLTGIQVYERVECINVTFGKTQKLKSQRSKRSKSNVDVPSNEKSPWKKKSIFFDLPLTLADPDPLSRTCLKAYKIACSLEHNVVTQMPRGVVGKIDYELQLESLEIMRLLNMDTLDISIIQFFIRSLKATSIIGGKKTSRQVKWITCSLLERQGRLSYNQKEIDEVRDIWCQYLVDEWVDRLLL